MGEASQEKPPMLTGYTYIRPLGKGGFAEVYLYDQNMPRRRVAIKVLRSTAMGAQTVGSFRTEANMMAQVSSHPAIVTIFEASITPDGRPYLAMEYCVGDYSSRYKAEQIPVSEILYTGVKIGGALQTLHQSGLLHRDIKPANILVTRFGLPVLADFGITASLAAMNEETVGMSVPWSAPEVVRGETTGTVLSEVFAFAATLYTLFEGHSPVQIPGKDNSSKAMEERLRAGKFAPLTRSGVPVVAQAVIERGLAKDPRRRPSTIREVVDELRRAETSFGYAATAPEYAGKQVIEMANGGDEPESTVVRSSVAYESRRPARSMPQFAAPVQKQQSAVPKTHLSRAKLVGVIVVSALVAASIAVVIVLALV